MPIRELSFLTDREKEILQKNQITTLEELLYYFPYKYLEAPKEKMIRDVVAGEYVTISGLVIKIKSNPGMFGKAFTKIKVEDGTGSIDAIWWHMPYLAKNLQNNQSITLTGTVAKEKINPGSLPKLFLNSPKILKNQKISINSENSLFQDTNQKQNESRTGIYTPLRNGKHISIVKILRKALKSPEFKNLPNIIPKTISQKLNLGNRQNAILRRHFPQGNQDLITTSKYFAFEEIFIVQIYREYEKKLRQNGHANTILLPKNFDNHILEILPFPLTAGQKKVLNEILNDLQKSKPMSRLVEGDVGSGKTILALVAAYATVNSFTRNKKPLQVCFLAPTEILAKQHFETFITILSPKNLTLALLTRNGAKIFPSKINPKKAVKVPKSRIQKLLNEGKIQIVIGTHALFNKNILFENLGLIIIDEQHRFGVRQRMNLIEKHKKTLVFKEINNKNHLEDFVEHRPIPHLLSMSATPIPRTLALTIYGDLELSILDELPPGRKRAITTIATPKDRYKIYQEMLSFLQKNKQVYIIVPKISHEEAVGSLFSENLSNETTKKTSVEFEKERLKKFLKENSLESKYKFGILHGQLTKEEKEVVIQKFYENEIQILISTTVVEVGVSIPRATFMIIENADSFGLAQLHQLRGRIERSTDISYCFLISETQDEKTLGRLKALEKTKSGFELAEIDLSERGPGSLIGNRQSGLSDIGMEAIKNRKLVEIAKREAEKLLQLDPQLSLGEHQALKEKIKRFSVHEE